MRNASKRDSLQFEGPNSFPVRASFLGIGRIPRPGEFLRSGVDDVCFGGGLK